MTHLFVMAVGLVFVMFASVASAAGYPDTRLAQSRGWGGDPGSGYAGPVAENGGAFSRGFTSDAYEADGYIDADGRWVERPRGTDQQFLGPDDDSLRGWPAESAEPDVWSPSGAGSGWGADGRSEAWRTPNQEPAYRFRGDPPPGAGGWTPRDSDGGYRFRPLNARESERRVQEPGWRPLAPDSASPAGRQFGQGGLIDALTPPARIYGFEPNPWP